tara:strand:+ start:123 stop:464 length:342 start_codon:yes stop_codon:yes gene_type:complete
MNFITAIKTCLTKYATFSGRASRSEFWYFFLFGIIFGIATLLIDIVLGFSIDETGPINSIFNLIVFLPFLSVSIRRLHDIGRSGWWYLIILTGIGSILLFYWWASAEKNGEKN